MSTTNNVNAYEIQLNNRNDGSNGEVNELISDMVSYGASLESLIPPGTPLGGRPRPTGEIQSAQFQASITQLTSAISTDLLESFNSFLKYIILMEDYIAENNLTSVSQ